ncbi:phosphonate C-P lyase system protein PhnG [Sphingomonas sp. TX0543]|nr:MULTISPECIES: phosphonate C-P lyase system protein PhnG [Sphingomonadaceae]MBI0533281.1 phosphonate C-P lyase system protein PhnG [Sphingomonas sp. TX0522]RQW37000.1 phosphonate C-P lyase system protein PhnG [Novosphingobium sp. LASN5T]
MENALPQGTGADTARADWIGILSRARADDVENLAAAHLADVDFEWLRAPHVGLVMVRGRAGGTGAQFNLGEMTVTRCSVRLPDGAVGHGYASGRSRRQAELAALLDARLQQHELQATLLEQVIEPLRKVESDRRLLASRKAAATKVEFFTMVRGDNLS